MLGEFMAAAEAYRIKGESIRPKQASETILDTVKSVKLPATLHIEPSPLEFELRTVA
jgi:hypothetical protein